MAVRQGSYLLSGRIVDWSAHPHDHNISVQEYLFARPHAGEAIQTQCWCPSERRSAGSSGVLRLTIFSSVQAIEDHSPLRPVECCAQGETTTLKELNCGCVRRCAAEALVTRIGTIRSQIDTEPRLGYFSQSVSTTR
eukprot:scaffold52968_cov74-Phaeocystis_antarctica.AAC.5